MNTLAKIEAFLLGMYEFRRSMTTRVFYSDLYDRGREFAHCLTLRRFEE